MKKFFFALLTANFFLCASEKPFIRTPSPKRNERKIDVDALIEKKSKEKPNPLTRVRRQSFGSKDYIQSQHQFMQEENMKTELVKRNRSETT